MSNRQLWEKFKTWLWSDERHGLALDISRMNFADNFFEGMAAPINKAFSDMRTLETGAVANPDEQRMVGHYWLRNPALAPTAEIKDQINNCLIRIRKFAQAIHRGEISSEGGAAFKHLLLIGIGGSALGPQFLTRALGSAKDPLDCFFFDNTDPDGMEHTLAAIPDLSRTLCIVISKSGGTKETRNGMLVAEKAWQAAGLNFAKSAVAVTGEGSELERYAQTRKWLAHFPMWDWVGGRTSELSAVGLLPAALQGFDVDKLLLGARDMDEITRAPVATRNPAALLALMWHFAGQGRGAREMVVLPYCDRLELFSRYLQQLVMESLGKEKDLDGRIVHQGLTVYGNKGSTDQHAYVQQLRDGLSNFFVVFIEVLQERSAKTGSEAECIAAGFNAARVEVEAGVSSADYLSGFFQGTRRALYESGRQSLTLTVRSVDEYSVGGLIALFERAVGLYASLININAYHQPGVEAGKRAAARVIELQKALLKHLAQSPAPLSLEELAAAIDESEGIETLYLILRRLAANKRVEKHPATAAFGERYSMVNRAHE